MFLRFVSIVALLNSAHSVENPCKGRVFQCEDVASSCAVIFPKVGEAPNQETNPNCFDTTSPDNVFAVNCRSTCELCCLEPQYNCDDDPIPNLPCPDEESWCTAFVDINFAHCRSACGWCERTTAPCIDALDTEFCKNLKNATGDLCSMPEVNVQCAKTCEVCIPDDCADASTRCSIWATNGFCEDPFYTEANAPSMYCKRTCDLC
ncbi:hypothetical protein PENTCL1PPCAC_24504 [Pristionchus entomophagus]|uniref:ShKT domain-containing protein n=1 Tax=Pristionchus entomophagus TaxID=358040 RepID=A0AAV5U675_9BILA|nr:hypothetical protein PENTCL1PPCAC_24504 [Pristionchus entomophagus]